MFPLDAMDKKVFNFLQKCGNHTQGSQCLLCDSRIHMVVISIQTIGAISLKICNLTIWTMASKLRREHHMKISEQPP